MIGVYRNNFDASLSTKNGFPVFATIIEANYINKKEDMFAAYRLTDDDKKMIQNMAKDKRIGRKVYIYLTNDEWWTYVYLIHDI